MPWRTKAGDLICIILGCPIPLILSKLGSYYQLVGACFVKGIMYGEATRTPEPISLLGRAAPNLQQLPSFASLPSDWNEQKPKERLRLYVNKRHGSNRLYTRDPRCEIHSTLGDPPKDWKTVKIGRQPNVEALDYYLSMTLADGGIYKVKRANDPLQWFCGFKSSTFPKRMRNLSPLKNLSKQFLCFSRPFHLPPPKDIKEKAGRRW